MPPFQIPVVYLFNGHLVQGKDKKNLEPEPGSLELLRNYCILSRGVGEKKFKLWTSNESGILYESRSNFVERPSPIHSLTPTREFRLIPDGMLPLLWGAEGDGWVDSLEGFFAKAGLAGVALQLMQVEKTHLAPPGASSSPEYKALYGKIAPGEKLSGYVITKARSLLVTFSSADYKGAKVQVEGPGGAMPSRTVDAVDGLAGHFAASFVGDKKALPDGLYKVTIAPATGAILGPRHAKSKSYVFYEKANFLPFSITAEVAHLVADGISLEEALLGQFPVHFAGQIAQAKKVADAKELEVNETLPPTIKPLEDWIGRINWIQGKAKFAAKLYNAGTPAKRRKDLLKYVLKQNTGVLGEEWKKSFDLGFGIYEKFGEWAEFRKKLAASEKLKALQPILAKDLPNIFDRNKWWNHLRDTYVTDKKNYLATLDLGSMSEKARKKLYKAGIPKEISNVEKDFGKAGKALEKAFVVVDTVDSFVQAGFAVNEVFGTKAALSRNLANFNDLADQYKAQLQGLPNRHGIGVLERHRAMTVTGSMDVDKAAAEAYSKALDTVLGVAALIPIAQEVAGLIVMVKETFSLAMDAVDELDKWALGNYLAAAKQQWALQSQLLKQSAANQDQLADHRKAGQPLQVQFRIRAEALYGLVGLITRASIKSKSPQEFSDAVKAFRIKEYIDAYVLNDGWQMPVYPLVPISLDSAWLQAISPLGLYPDAHRVAAALGIDQPLASVAMAPIPGGVSLLAFVNSVAANHVRVTFHDSFPIHRMEAADVDALCKCFRTDYGGELSKDIIAYTRLYRRDPGSAADAPWIPYEPAPGKGIDSLTPLSPLDQIRVLVVLKKGAPQGFHPITLRLLRTDGLNIAGPEYEEYCVTLKGSLLPEEKEFEDRIGCVFHPFYQLGIQSIPGIKPLAGSAVKMLGVNNYYNLGYLWDMTYAFEVEIGSAKTRQYLKLGGTEKNRTEHDDFPVDMRARQRPLEKKLLIADFLMSHTEEFSYPELFQLKQGLGPILLRVGGKDHWIGIDEEKTFLKFDWKQPVELIVTFWVGSVITDSYEKAGIDWKQTPVSLTLHSDELGLDTKGPTYQGRLCYLGKYHTSESKKAPPGTLMKGNNSLDGNLSPLVDTLLSGDAQRKQWFEEGIDKIPFGSMADKYDVHNLFAAHFEFYYYGPDNARCDSVRPFAASMPEPGTFYEYYFSLSSPTGLNGLESNARFKLEAPPLDGSRSPWNHNDKAKKWIEKDGQRIDASPTIQ